MERDRLNRECETGSERENEILQTFDDNECIPSS